MKINKRTGISRFCKITIVSLSLLTVSSLPLFGEPAHEEKQIEGTLVDIPSQHADGSIRFHILEEGKAGEKPELPVGAGGHLVEINSFVDSFEKAKQAKWKDLEGVTSTVGGKLVASNSRNVTIVEGLQSENARTSVTVSSPVSSGIVLRARDKDNFVLAYYSPAQQIMGIHEMVNGEWKPLGTAPTPTILTDRVTLAVVMEADILTLTLKDSESRIAKFTAKIVSTVTPGNIGLYHDTAAKEGSQEFDNFQVSAKQRVAPANATEVIVPAEVLKKDFVWSIGKSVKVVGKSGTSDSTLPSITVTADSGITAIDQKPADALFSTSLPLDSWATFPAKGFAKPVTGIVYRDPVGVRPVSGVAIGSFDVGCIDVESSGLLGYNTIFNSLAPRGGPLNVPFLGMSVGGKTWVMTTGKTKRFLIYGDFLQLAKLWGKDKEVIPDYLELAGCEKATRINYWGHYPMADMEFETDAPVSVGVRAWGSHLPGNVKDSLIPGAVFDVYLRNTTDQPQKGTLAFSFPGPSPGEAGSESFTREESRGGLDAISVKGKLASFAIGVGEQDKPRFGGALNDNGPAWAGIAKALPVVENSHSGASAAVDYELAPGAVKTVRYILSWSAPTWEGRGKNGAQPPMNTYTHMYDKYYPDAVTTAKHLATNGDNLLKKIVGWQEEIYQDKAVPGWLADSLINSMYLMAEVGIWAQTAPPIDAFSDPEEGYFGLNESPRACPDIECAPCTYYGGMVETYFFPDLLRTQLRAYRALTEKDGGVPIQLGAMYDMKWPIRGGQTGQSGSWLTGVIARYWMRTGDTAFIKELWPYMKFITDFVFTSNPAKPYGLISLPDFDLQESFESRPFSGMASHVGSIRLYHAKIMERMAVAVGDKEYEKQCKEWYDGCQDLMEKHLWKGNYYIQSKEWRSGRIVVEGGMISFVPESNTATATNDGSGAYGAVTQETIAGLGVLKPGEEDVVMGYQLDGEFMALHDGIAEGVFPPERVKATLDTLTKTAVGTWGARVWSKKEGGPTDPAIFPTGYWTPEGTHIPSSLNLGALLMYKGQKEAGLELAKNVMFNYACRQGWHWEAPILTRADNGMGLWGNDYGQMMGVWNLLAAVNNTDFRGPTQPGGLVDRVIKAAAADNAPAK